MPSFIWDHVLTDLCEKSGRRSSKRSSGRFHPPPACGLTKKPGLIRVKSNNHSFDSYHFANFPLNQPKAISFKKTCKILIFWPKWFHIAPISPPMVFTKESFLTFWFGVFWTSGSYDGQMIFCKCSEIFYNFDKTNLFKILSTTHDSVLR